MSLKLKRILFRSFLRWNRRPAVVQSFFEIDPSDIGIESFLPPGVHRIYDRQGVHGAISLCFRRPQPSNQNARDPIDVGFEALRKLNELGETLTDRHQRRMKNSNIEVYSKAKFQIGQIVIHKPSGCRCVVIGWDFTEDDMHPGGLGLQYIEAIRDEFDRQKMTPLNTSMPQVGEYISSSEFAALSDPQLKRLQSPFIQKYFTEFDTVRGVFTPNESQRFIYPVDLELEDLKGNEETKKSSKAELLEFEVERRKEKERAASQSLIRSVGLLGRKLLAVLRRSDMIAQGAFTSNGAHDDGLGDESISTEREKERAATHAIVQGVFSPISSLVHRCASFSTDFSSSEEVLPSSIPDNAMTSTSTSSASRDSRYATWRTGSVERLLFDNSDEAVVRSSAVKSHKGTCSAEEVNQALESLRDTLVAAETVLQLRFQKRGDDYFESLGAFFNHAGEGEGEGEGERVGIVIKDATVEELFLPAAVYEVGQVLRHKTVGYRCIVAGWNIRPLERMSGPKGANEQPFYRVIADEEDLDRLLPNRENVDILFVAQDLLEPVTPEEMLTLGGVCQGPGRHMFGSYDKQTHRHQVPQLLLFTFPPGGVQADVEVEGVDGTSSSPASPSPLHAIEQRAFKALEVIYLEIYFILKASLARTRKQRVLHDRSREGGRESETQEAKSTEAGEQRQSSSSNSSKEDPDLQIADILYLLKSSRRSHFAFTLSEIDHLTKIAHTDIKINAAMRRAMGHQIRGDSPSAHDDFSEAALLDLSYTAPHDFLCKMYHSAGLHTQSADKALDIVTLSPSDDTAWTRLGMARESLGNLDGAVSAYGKALEVNPWNTTASSNLSFLLTIPMQKIEEAGRSALASDPDPADG